MDVNRKVVGQRIRNIRQSKGLTLEEFGNLLIPKATRSNVSKWERGSSLPSNERLPLIAELGDMTVDELLYRERTLEQYSNDELMSEIKRRLGI